MGKGWALAAPSPPTALVLPVWQRESRRCHKLYECYFREGREAARSTAKNIMFSKKIALKKRMLLTRFNIYYLDTKKSFVYVHIQGNFFDTYCITLSKVTSNSWASTVYCKKCPNFLFYSSSCIQYTYAGHSVLYFLDAEWRMCISFSKRRKEVPLLFSDAEAEKYALLSKHASWVQEKWILNIIP